MKTSLNPVACTVGPTVQYLALDMAVYAGHATFAAAYGIAAAAMWVLVIINMPALFGFGHCRAGCPAFAGYPGHPVNGGGCDCQPE